MNRFSVIEYLNTAKGNMTIKRCIAVSILILALAPCTKACISENTDHNYYMFSVFKRDRVSPAYLYDIASYWQRYTDIQKTSVNLDFYTWNKDDILKAAQAKKDIEMQTYLKRLNAYLKACDTLYPDAWRYASKQERLQTQQSLTQIANAARLYKGSKLRSQYALLRMRINMVQKLDRQNITYWNTVASKLPQSVWKEAMLNIYARALWKTGNRQQALDIYARQGDILSIKAVARNYRNLAGIQSIYLNNPNSPMLAYLVQDFVNNHQQTIDSNEKSLQSDGTIQIDKEWIELIGAKVINKKEALDFITFANKVVAEGKTKSPCLWRSATAMLHYLNGDTREAWNESNEAMALNGTQRMKDNARTIHLLASIGSGHTNSQFLVNEFKWLDSKAQEESNTGYYGNHYTEVQERIAYRALTRLYHQRSMLSSDSKKIKDYESMDMAMYGMMDAYERTFRKDEQDEQYISRYLYSSEYAARLDTLTARQLACYYEFITTRHDDVFEQYVCQSLYRNADFFHDMIGTKYIAEGNFTEAANWLKKVSLSFVNSQPISFYAAKRSYAIPYWFNRQKVNDNDIWDIDKEYAQMTENPKLKFCQEMNQLVSKYNLSREGKGKEKLAYELAVRYYQASCYGDCWYLTHYGKSICDSARVREADFAAIAQKYLMESKQSADLHLRYHSLYALSSMGIQPWYKTVYDDDWNASAILCPHASQYQAMQEWSLFAKEYPQIIDSYTTKCDVLKDFEAKTMLTASFTH